MDDILWGYHLTETSLVVLSHANIYKHVVLSFESVDKILWRDHSTETSSVVLSHGTINFISM